MSKYRICFEVVTPIGRGAKYYNRLLSKPICKSVEVDENDWAETENNTDDPWSQFNTLKKWETSGKHLIRNVRLYETSETIKDITRAFSLCTICGQGPAIDHNGCVIIGMHR